MHKIFSNLLCIALVATCGLNVNFSAKAQLLPKTSTKIEPAVLQLTLKHQEKDNVWNYPPTLKVNSKKLASRPNVIKYHAPIKNQAPERFNVTAADGSKIYGCMIYNSTWTEDNQPYGMYSFNIGDGSTITPLATGDDYIATGGGVYANGKFYFVSYYSLMGYYIADLNICDFETWTIEEQIPVDAGSVARDMTYDPITGNVYGCFINDDMDGWVFGRMSLETGERTVLRDLDLVFVTIAANSKGEIYGIDLLGDLYQFDKNTGAKTKIGNTGRTPAYSASGCFDLRTDKFYWECMESDGVARVFEVNTTDASLTLSTILPNQSEIVSMFIPVPEANDDAPAAVSDYTINFENESLSGTVSFTMPSTTYAEKALSGSLDYTLNINEETYNSGRAAAGEKVTIPVTLSQAGDYRFAVTTSNSAGTSPVAMIEKWVGYDVPAAVTNLKLSKGSTAGSVKLSWSAVKTTVHGGYIDAANVSYRIVRQPDNVTVAEAQTATSFTESLPTDGTLTTYYYEVYAINNNQVGAVATSNSLTFGLANLPFEETFEDNGISLFYVVDANGDGYTWTYDATWNAARYRYSSANNYNTPADDWLFSPMFNMKNDRLYYVEFGSHCYYSSDPERIEVKLGTAQTVSAMKQEVFPVTNITNEVTKSYSKYIKVAEDNTYSLGFHACSLADKMYLYLDKVIVNEGPKLGTPGSVSNLKAVAGENGALYATISFTAPSVDVEGATLSAIEGVKIYRDGKLITTQSTSIGQAVTFTDEKAVQGYNNYDVVAYNSIGDGFTQSVTVFVGHDVPGLVSDVKAIDDNGIVTISWQAPTAGANKGYFDASVLTYTVLRANDEQIIADGIKDLSIEDDDLPLSNYQQDFFAYYVFAKSPAGYGDGQMSNIVAVGTPWALPFKESFANAALTNDPWDVEAPSESSAYWTIVTEGSSPYAEPQDSDSGLVSFVPSEEGDEATLYSGKIDFSKANNPILEFYYYVPTDCFDYLTTYVSVDGGDFQAVNTISYRTITETASWQKASIDLKQFQSAKYIQLAFEGKSYNGEYNLHLDNIKVKNVYNYNLSINSFSFPERVKTGVTYKAVVDVENSGIVPASKYTVQLFVNGEVYAEQDGVSLLQDKSNEFTFEVTPTVHFGEQAVVSASVIFDKDQDTSDNSSEKINVLVIQPNYPAVDDLDATLIEGTVELTWNEPLPAETTGATIDGAESYKAFAITNIGQWTMIDRDKSETYGIGNSAGSSYVYDNATKPMAFMVFNPQQAGIVVDGSVPENDIWIPYAGSQMFASFAAQSGQNDDWMISPELPGEAQEISMFVKSALTTWGYEQYEILYSSTGDDVDDFIKIGGTRNAPEEWTEVKVVLPAGSKYFAIHCVSPDCFAFLVDNIKYLPQSAVAEELSLIGYNVYCNKQKLNDSPIEDLSYIHTLPDVSKKEYYVTVVYDKGESPMSNIVTIYPSSVIDALTNAVKVSAQAQNIRVENAANNAISVFAADGKLIAATTANSDNELIPVIGNAVYIVIVDNVAHRVAVK